MCSRKNEELKESSPAGCQHCGLVVLTKKRLNSQLWIRNLDSHSAITTYFYDFTLSGHTTRSTQKRFLCLLGAELSVAQPPEEFCILYSSRTRQGGKFYCIFNVLLSLSLVPISVRENNSVSV